MRVRFVSKYHKRDLFDKPQNMKQGSRSVEEYYKEMEKAIIRGNVDEVEEQTMACFMSSLNYPIKQITKFQPYNAMVEFVHQATKAERQVQQDARAPRSSSFTPHATSYGGKTTTQCQL